MATGDKVIIGLLLLAFVFFILNSIYQILSVHFLWGVRGSVFDFDRTLQKKERYDELSKDFYYDNMNKSILKKSEKNIHDEMKIYFDKVKQEKRYVDDKMTELLSIANKRAVHKYMARMKYGRSGKSYQRASAIIAEYDHIYHPKKRHPENSFASNPVDENHTPPLNKS